MNMHQQYCLAQLNNVKAYFATYRVMLVGDVLTTKALDLYRGYLAAQEIGDHRAMLTFQRHYDNFVQQQLLFLGIRHSSRLMHQLESCAEYYIFLDNEAAKKRSLPVSEEASLLAVA